VCALSIWKKFSSIENSYQTKVVNAIRSVVPSNELWVVTEKIDGENACISASREGLRIGKRSTLLPEGASFGGVLNFAERYEYELKAAYSYILNMHSSLNVDYESQIVSVSFFGESFGGVYPHKDVSKVAGAKKIQGRVYYCPHNDFRLFDIAIVVDYNGVLKNVYLGFNEFLDICNRFTLPYIYHMFIGTLDECLGYNVQFKTIIPSIYNLPIIEGNFAEGIVMKPVREYTLCNGDRVILKKKSDKFSEKNHKKEIITQSCVSEELKELFTSASQYVTENRLMNIISHFGEVSKSDFGEVLKEFNCDVFDDFCKEAEIVFYDKPTEKALRKYINGECSKLMRSKFLPMC